MRALSFILLAPLVAATGCYSPDYGSPGFFCHPDDNPSCPDGQMCVGGRCVGGGGGFDMGAGIVPKTMMYTGPKLDPMLNDETACTDSALEPNDSIQTAVPGLTTSLMLQVDQPSSKLQMLAICPKGDNPKASGHDLDFYEFDVSANVYATVEIFYDVKYGDLDVGVFKGDGTIVSYDGSAVTDGCTATQLAPGMYYVGVGGANNMDSNRYDMRIRLYSTMHACTASAPDGGV